MCTEQFQCATCRFKCDEFSVQFVEKIGQKTVSQSHKLVLPDVILGACPDMLVSFSYYDCIIKAKER